MNLLHDHAAPTGRDRISVTVGGERYSCVVAGDGPPVVLLHGWPQTSSTWDALIPLLTSAGHRVIAPDLRGIGASSRAVGGYSKDAQAEDLEMVLRELGEDETGVHVVGHDVGGMVAFAMARRRPGSVASLTLMELAIPGLGLESAMNVATGGRWHFGFFMAEPYPEMLIEGREDEFFTRWFADLSHRSDVFTPARVATLAQAYRGRAALRASLSHYRTLRDDIEANRTWLDHGGLLTMPVLAVGGEHAVAGRLAAALAPVAPHLASAVIADSGHFVVEENLGDVARVLLEHLGRVEHLGHQEVETHE